MATNEDESSREWTDWLAAYQELGLEEAVAKADAEGRHYRIIGPKTAVTLDLRPDRLNLYVDAGGDLTRMWAG